MLTGMPKEVLYSKLVFIDSHDGVRGAKTLKPSFHIPSNAFGCSQGESMRLVLKSFTMQIVLQHQSGQQRVLL